MNLGNRNGRSSAFLALSLTSLVALTFSQSWAKEAAQVAAQPKKTVQKTAQVQKPAVKPLPAVSVPVSSAESMLQSRIREIGQNFNGDIGIAVRDIQTGYTAAYDGSTYFPQQSVSKFFVALTALDRADRGYLSMKAPVTVTKADLTLFHQPIAKQIGPGGYSTTLDSLMFRAITQSDNTCNDFILWKAGGPEAVRSFLADKRISGIRFGPGERMLQARIAGMEWRPSMVGANFYEARNALPMSLRRTSFENYIRDPMDGATPLGLVDALTRLKQGELLSPRSTERLLSIMSQTRTGANRLKGGLAPGWKLAHKTGTGQVLGGTQAGYNDIGIVTGPDGRSYAVAVMIRRTASPLPHRMQAMQNVVRATISYANALPASQRFAKRTQTEPYKAPVQQPRQPAPTGLQSVAATVDALAEEDGE
ncbi:MAG TPA: class A beta-lactamase [Allosphingosinicella sp.]|uniref:class A beta-lactamase n=1 Tax=Allosphingosinicella sp. TaxID=2823234 RepID=UPI002EDA9659